MMIAAIAVIGLTACYGLGIEERNSFDDGGFAVRDVDIVAEDSDSGMVRVSFVPVTGYKTKSSIDADEDMLRDYQLVIFRDGMLELSRFVECGGSGVGASLDVPLVKGVEYNLYAVGNIGRIVVPLREEEFLSGSLLKYGRPEDIHGVLPMAWKEKGRVFFAGEGSVTVAFERLVAKVIFSIDSDSILKGLRVKSVRMRQAAGIIWPFGVDGSDESLLKSADEAVDGDYATKADLELINGGGSLVFYCLENCQGNLLPDNGDEWAKVPENLEGNLGRLCTYLEVEASFLEDFALSGGVIYRLFLGEDTTGNFDVRRNTVLNVSLFATRDGLDEVCWRVEAEGEYREGLAEGRLLSCAHPLDAVYVGEIFRYGVTLSQSLADYLGEELGECRVSSLGGSVAFSAYSLSGLELTCDGACIEPAQGETLLLETPRGNIILDENVNVLRPSIRFSDVANTGPSVKVSQSTVPTLKVNGEQKTIYVYLVDGEGYNLNSEREYGFDPSLFSFSHEMTAYPGTMAVSQSVAANLLSSLKAESLDQDEFLGDNRALAAFVLRADNPGTDSELNRNLGYAVFARNPFSLDVNEENFGFNASESINYDIFPVKVTAYGPWTEENRDAASELLLGISNPSAIYLDILSWTQARKSNSTTHSMQTWATRNRNDITSAGVETLDYMYATDKYFPSLEPYERKHYGSYSAFQYDKALIGGSNLEEHFFRVPSSKSATLLERYIGCDPAGYLTELSSSATEYEGTGWWYSFRNHYTLDIKADGLNLVVSGRLVFEDKFLEGGDAESSETYPNFGGFNVYSDGMLHTQSTAFLSTYYSCTPFNLYGMVNCSPLALRLGYDSSAKKYYLTCSNNSGGKKIEIKYSVQMNGTVTCHPNGQWYKAVEHNVSGSVAQKYTENLQVGPSRTYIDGGDVRTLMNKIYAMSYLDNSSNTGVSGKDFQHFCHPTDGTLTFEIRSLSSGALLPYTITVDPSAEAIDFYHSQDEKTYSVKMTLSYPSYWQFGLIK